MSENFILGWAISALFLPPLNLILLCVFGLLLQRKWARLGFSLSLASLTLLATISSEAGALLLLKPLEDLNPPLDLVSNSNAQAIVVLGGKGAIELVRSRYAAKLQRETGLPVLVSGKNSDISIMLLKDFKVPVRWIEKDSITTAENAELSTKILRGAGFKNILLVTDAIHMPRAKASFARVGFNVIAAPTGFCSIRSLDKSAFLPSGEGLSRSAYAIHEWLGIVWYSVRYGIMLNPKVDVKRNLDAYGKY